MTIRGLRVIVLLYKALNALRRAPLLWFLEFQKTVYEMGGQDTFESTLFRITTKKGFILVLVYVFFLLVELLSVRCAPVSERAKACKEAKGNRKQKTENKPNPNNNPNKPNKKTNTRNTTTKQDPLLQVKQVKRVRRNPHRIGGKLVYEALVRGKL